MSRGRTVPFVSTADLEHPSLLPSVLLGDLRDGSRPGRSPRDWFVDVTAFLLAVLVGGAIFAYTADTESPSELLFAVDFLAGMAACCALWVRRRWPVGLALAIVPLTTFSSMASIASCVALFTVAVHRPTRTLLPVAALYLAAVPIYTVLRPGDENFWLNVTLGVFFIVLLIAWGMFVRARRQLVYSLRDRAQRAEAEQELRIAQARRMERDRIAREMHDVLAHRISLVSLHAGALEYSGASSPDEVARAAGVIRGAAHQALDDLREIIGVLREDGEPVDAPERPQPTIADLDTLLAESRDAGMRVQGELALAEGVPTSVGRNAYRVVQEGLTNARKHASDCAVAVAVAGAPGDGVTIEVRNRLPVGRLVAEIPGAGTGIVGLTERVALAGGRLEHGPREGEWRLWAWLPWPAS